MAYWILRSEPETYGWDDLVRDGTTEWDGVRNATARIHLKAMAPGDTAMFYHSGKQKACVGTMRITRGWRPDGDDGNWASVEVTLGEKLPHPVTLAEIKAEPRLKDMELLRQSRLSVAPVRAAEWELILAMAERPA